MPQRITASPFFRPDTAELRYLPESPRIVDGRLYWVSIQYGPDSRQGGLNVLDIATRTNRHHPLPGRPGFIADTGQPGELLIGLENRLVRYNMPARQVTATLATIPDNPRVIMNDGIAIPGGVIFGTKDVQFADPIAALYHYDFAAAELRELRGGQVCSNGKLLRDGKLIDIDSQPRTITEYRYDGALHELRLIKPPDSLPAIPDGMRPAPDGASIVVAFVNTDARQAGLAQQIRISDGEVLAEWIFPGAPRVTCPELGTLDGEPCWFFTTAAEGLKDDELPLAPHAGTIFVAPATSAR
ncbi:MAG TPA: SMP-30/gluconolactonase/LRE family protein [Candidatus Acidoferrales bacterium]|nr:SMP-30/gluconolactonase/LRE family protein [Candidatus Acidoferrales bacterium]